MELTQLQAMIAIQDGGSFQNAAEALGVSRATLRQLVERLEEELGTSLLIRGPSGTTPTAAGKELLSRARYLVREFSRLREEFREQTSSAPRTVHIQVPPGMPSMVHVAALLELENRHPDLRIVISILSGPHENLSEDVHLRLQFGAPPPKGPFRTFVVSRFPERLLATQAYLEEHGMPGSLEELQAHRLLSWIPPGEDGCRWPLLAGGSIEVTPFARSHDIAIIRQMAALNAGIAYVPDSPLIPASMGGELEVVLPELVGRESALRALIPEALADSSGTRDLVDVTRELIERASGGLLMWQQELPPLVTDTGGGEDQGVGSVSNS